MLKMQKTNVIGTEIDRSKPADDLKDRRRTKKINRFADQK